MKLRVGTGALRLEEVDAAFTDTDCVVRLPGVCVRPEYSATFAFPESRHPSSLLPLLFQMVGSGVGSFLLKYKVPAPKSRLVRVVFYS